MDKNSFMFAILNNPSLTQKDRERVISLITRDIEKDLMSRTQEFIREELRHKENGSNDVPQDQSLPKTWIHDPRTVCDFLKLFSSDPTIKYIVHSWDTGEFRDYDEFIDKITRGLKNERTFNQLYFYNIGLNYTLKRFIFCQDENEFSIPRENLQIGLQYPVGVIKSWMEANPGRKMSEVPMSAFPAQNRPRGRFNGRSIANFEQLLDYYKHLISFRDSDFEEVIYDTFRNSDFKPIIDDSVKGIAFYTYTGVVKSFLSMAFDNIRDRVQNNGAPGNVKISVTNSSKDSFELHILHVGSFSKLDINDSKLLDNGFLASWRKWQNGLGGNYNSLLSVCDYSVVSKFYSEDKELKSYRIDYLYPGLYGIDESSRAPRIIPLEEDVPGFEYIMTFYK